MTNKNSIENVVKDSKIENSQLAGFSLFGITLASGMSAMPFEQYFISNPSVGIACAIAGITSMSIGFYLMNKLSIDYVIKNYKYQSKIKTE